MVAGSSPVLGSILRTKMNPKFTIFTGPMFGSKTTRLFAALDRYKYQKRNIVAFKPKIDNRYSEANITTHSGASMPARIVESGTEVMHYMRHHDKYDVVAVDEAFMLKGISWVLIDLFKQGKTIVVSSLDLSATGKDFDEITAMFPWATHIEKCPAVCTVCGDDAYYTYKKVKDLEEIAVGGAELYEPRCWTHIDFMKEAF
jgi:thymidine kinase